MLDTKRQQQTEKKQKQSEKLKQTLTYGHGLLTHKYWFKRILTANLRQTVFGCKK